MRNSPPIIGITGISGSGASTAAAALGELGGLVVSADGLAREAMRKGEKAHAKIAEAFGGRMLRADGEIDRKALAALVFGEKGAGPRRALEEIVHPVVLEKIAAIMGAAGSDCPFAVIDAPLLVESGLSKICRQVWLVKAPYAARLARITARDGIGTEAAMMRLASRQGDGELERHADRVFVNDGSAQDLKTAAARAYLEMRDAISQGACRRACAFSGLGYNLME